MKVKHSDGTSYRQNWFIDFLSEDRYRIYRHLLIWLYLIFTELDDIGDITAYSGNFMLYFQIVKLILFLLMVYMNMYVLVPQLLFKDKYFIYIFTVIGMIVTMHLLMKGFFNYYFDYYPFSNAENDPDLFRELLADINLFGVLVFSSTSIKLFQRWKKDLTHMNELEKNSLESELRELKNQINPHFLFNMLNNVNVLVHKSPEQASMILLRLSDFLRYQLYETNRHLVSFKSEIRFLKDYMELEKIRRDDFDFMILTDMPEGVTDVSLPPNLFIIFAENAVKHSFDPDGPSEVILSFKVNKKELRLECTNTKPTETVLTSLDSGLGLTNITRRLGLLYGKDYVMEIRDNLHDYQVTLIIPL